MQPEPIEVDVERDLADLLPMFLEQRRQEQTAIAAALTAQDFQTIRRIGHGMVGSGGSYGFFMLSEMGEELVRVATARDASAVTVQAARIQDYLTRIKVRYV